MPDPLLNRLRQETTPAHTQLEDQVNITNRLQDVGLYQELLEKFLGFYEPLEKQFFAFSEWKELGIAPEHRYKADWIKQDLVALGLEQEKVDILPVCRDLPDASTFPRAVGCAYVLEGSTLGGRHIAAMLEKSSIPESARRFFQGYGGETGPNWKKFCEALSIFDSNSLSTDATVEAASATFDHLRVWMSEGGRRP